MSMTSELTGLRDEIRMQQAKHAALLRTAQRLRDVLVLVRDVDADTTYPVWPDTLDPILASPEVQALGREDT